MNAPSFLREKVVCNLCQKPTPETVLAERPGHVTPDLYQVVRCNECGLVYVNPRIRQDQIKLLYDQAYFSGKNWDDEVNYEESLHNRELFWRKYRSGNLPEILYHRPRLEGLKILDVGCALGNFMTFLKEQGAQVEGLEWSDYAAQKARAAGFTVHTGDILDLKLPAESYDVIVAREVLEHVVDPDGVFKAIARLLKPGGLFYFTTGNVGVNDVRTWDYVKPDGHIYFYSRRTLPAYFKKAGLKPVPRKVNFRYYIDYLLYGGHEKDWKIERLIRWGLVNRERPGLLSHLSLRALWLLSNWRRAYGPHQLPVAVKPGR